MPYYLFSYDVNAEAKPKTQKTVVDRALCELVDDGFEIRELELSTTYRLHHPEDKYSFIKNFVKDLLNDTDRRLVLEIVSYQSELGKTIVRMSERGTLIECD